MPCPHFTRPTAYFRGGISGGGNVPQKVGSRWSGGLTLRRIHSATAITRHVKGKSFTNRTAPSAKLGGRSMFLVTSTVLSRYLIWRASIDSPYGWCSIETFASGTGSSQQSAQITASTVRQTSSVAREKLQLHGGIVCAGAAKRGQLNARGSI